MASFLVFQRYNNTIGPFAKWSLQKEKNMKIFYSLIEKTIFIQKQGKKKK